MKIKGLIKNTDDEFVGIASTDAVDRHNEVIKQEGWILDSFKKNPVILASHDSQSFPIGKATELLIENGKLWFKFVLTDATEKAREAKQLIEEGILNTFSVGFIPQEYDSNDSSIITKAELNEISLVSVPANPNALVMAKGLKGNKMAQELIRKEKENAELIKEIGEKKASEFTKLLKQHKDAKLSLVELYKKTGSRKAKSNETEDISKASRKLLQSAVGHLNKALEKENKKLKK